MLAKQLYSVTEAGQDRIRDENYPGKIAFVADARATHMLHWASILADRGKNVLYISFDKVQRQKLKIAAVRPWLPGHYLKHIVNAPKIRSALRRFNPDIVHTYYLTNFALLASLSWRGRMVVTVAGSDLFREPEKSKLFHWTNRYVCSRASIIHSVAQHMTQRLNEMGFDPGKIVTFPEGVDANIFKPFTDELLSRPVHVVSTRNFQPVYDVETLIKAVPVVTRERGDCNFILIGDGAQRRYLQEIAEKLAVTSHVRFTGFRPWSDLAYNLHRAQIYVSTSLSDGMSSSLLQAMICGAFPVVADIPANQEWIRHGHNGFLFQVRDSAALAHFILKAIQQPALRQNAATINRRLVEEKGLDQKSVDLLLAVYRNLICSEKGDQAG